MKLGWNLGANIAKNLSSIEFKIYLTRRLKAQALRFFRWVRFCSGKRIGSRNFLITNNSTHLFVQIDFFEFEPKLGIWSICWYYNIIWVSIMERYRSKHSYWKWRPFNHVDDLKWTFMTFQFFQLHFSVFDNKVKNFRFHIDWIRNFFRVIWNFRKFQKFCDHSVEREK